MHAYYNLVITVMPAEPQGNTQLAAGVRKAYCVLYNVSGMPP